ncbi:carbohydrate porin [Caulobacter sp.]|uniref:carbohydrate porin n=1 Tax=Caulobacter sp. TaxID=78 RepID=UPI003BB1D326
MLPRYPAVGSASAALVLVSAVSLPAAAQETDRLKANASWTQFAGGLVGGDGDQDGRYGGYVAAEFEIDGGAVGLWEGASINVYPEYIYGRNVNGSASGPVFPVNVGLAYPSKDRDDFDVSLFVQQRIGRATVQFGKINSMRRGRATPMISGGGLEGFQHTVLASPPSIIGQPVRFGVMATIPLDGPTLSLGVWDPESTINKTGFEHPFETGVAGYAQLAFPVTLGGRSGSQKIAVYGSTKRGLDLQDVPEVILPPESETVLGQKKGQWHVQYSFHQHLHEASAPGGRGWGVFGRLGVWDGNPTPFRWQAALGVSGEAPFASRPQDRFGVGVFRTQLSATLRQGLAPIVVLDDETGAEIFYTLAVGGPLRLTASAEWVDPAIAARGELVYIGLRAKLEF